MSTHHNTTRRPVCRTRCVGILLFALALSAPLGVTSAQLPGDSLLRVGMRVRVATVNPDSAIGTRRAIGVLHTHIGDSMTVAWENGLRSTLTPAEISRMDTSLGPQPYALRGMALGFLSGAVAGGIIGALTYEPTDFLDSGIGVNIAAGAVVLGVAGTVVGGIVGAAGRREGWSPVPLDRGAPRVSVSPLLGVTAQGLRVVVRF